MGIELRWMVKEDKTRVLQYRQVECTHDWFDSWHDVEEEIETSFEKYARELRYGERKLKMSEREDID